MNIQLQTTVYQGGTRQTTRQTIPLAADEGRENELINLYPDVTYQKFRGFGGAITDSAAYMYAQLNAEQKAHLLDTYFNKDQMGYRYVRISIDSCDFSLAHYEADGEEADTELKDFSFDRVEQYILPMLRDAEKAYGGKLRIMLAPWSPPAYMKTTGERNQGGKLKPACYARWAEYICRYIQEYKDRGFHVTMLTLQNEPKAVQTWDSCVYTAAEERDYLRDYLYPALQRHGLDEVKLYIWDHNKERAYEWAKTILDARTRPLIDGVALHWYSGDHFEALRMIREQFPEQHLITSEACIEFRVYGTGTTLFNAQKYAHDIIGNCNEGLDLFFDWNLLLNEEGGPNHVGNFCDAPFLYHRDTHELTESPILAYLQHFTAAIRPGAVRIGFSRYTDKLEVTAFRQGDAVRCVVLNRTNETLPAWLRIGDAAAEITCPAQSISTAEILLPAPESALPRADIL